MAIYGLVWHAICGVLGALGIVLAFVIVPVDVMVTLMVAGVFAGIMAALFYWSETPDERSAHKRRWSILIPVVTTASLGIAGIGAVLGAGGTIGLMLIAAISSPPAARWYCSRLQHTPEADAESLPISTAELCQQWQDSYETLRGATTPAARLRIVEARQRCLDELERRDPEGLNAWLASTASAAGDPSRFLTGG
ncbi:hypothetical protein OG394_00880 [Kribbella sp. NBC_01245]|uniref:hypothetical protein n=1 Tax=Kribbella sp. NBC_01245 TaxID=2903578 RepID=UPI002E28EF09|nr:hypothetical protein [Kribbella sp. NBC_01245]